jgi:probable addiction module antidote protein
MNKDQAQVARFDAAEFLDDDETIAGYLKEAFESGDPADIAEAIGTVARARGMTEIARKAGVSRESLYRALSRRGNPELATLMSVLDACGLKLSAPVLKRAPTPVTKPKALARSRRRRAA